VEAPLATEVPFQPPPGVRLVVLFGSHGTPRARPDSDVDLLVVLDGDTPTARLAAAAALAASFDRPVDIVFEADAGPQLRFEVARSGRPLLARSERDWVRFKTAAMIDWWDWQPTATRLHAAYLARLRGKVGA
jgi:predicted nucleotidyltransferase